MTSYRMLWALLWTVAAGPVYSADLWRPSKVLGMTYPRGAMLARIQGTVIATCAVRPDGPVGDVSIVSGHPVLADSVVATLRRWVFQSTGGVVKDDAQVNITVTFQLQGSCDMHGKCKEEFWYESPGRVTVISELARTQIQGSRSGKSGSEVR
jgi:TonB family protein